jgi:signal transduction histidine kinase
MRRLSLNRLWTQFSIVITGVVLIAAIALLAVTFSTRPPEPADLPPPVVSDANSEFRRDPLGGFIKFATQSALVLIGTGTLFGIGAGVWLSRRMTAPLENLAQGAAEIGRGDLSVRVTPKGSAEMVELAEAFNRMTSDLQTAEQLRQHMLADVAHELRTPLTVLQGNLRAILDDVYPLDKAEIARLYDQTRHLHRLVNDLHELAQAEAGRLPLTRAPLDLAALAAEAVDVFVPIAEMEEVALTFGAQTTPLLVNADRARLMQVLQNLLANALRHTPAGGSVAVTVDRRAGVAAVAIQDSGDGIEAAHLPYLFDRFYRTDSARDRDAGGAGLGLAIVRALVEAHGGAVSVASQGRGAGSTFSVTLPLAG